MSVCNIPGAVLSPGGTKLIQIQLDEELTEMGGESPLKRVFIGCVRVMTKHPGEEVRDLSGKSPFAPAAKGRQETSCGELSSR